MNHQEDGHEFPHLIPDRNKVKITPDGSAVHVHKKICPDRFLCLENLMEKCVQGISYPRSPEIPYRSSGHSLNRSSEKGRHPAVGIEYSVLPVDNHNGIVR